jgi:hypothetical protein
MANTSAFCLAQETVQRERAASAGLENVRMIATKAAAAWAREAEVALKRESKTGREDALPAAASLSEKSDDLAFQVGPQLSV